MNMENELKILKAIHKVESPPFLYTRILNAIQKRQENIVPVKWVLASATLLIIVFALNIAIIHVSNKNNESDLTEIFLLKPQNTFYNE